MTKYDPYDGLKPKRNRMSKGMRQRWGALAAAAFGLYIYNVNNRSRAYGGGTNSESHAQSSSHSLLQQQWFPTC